MSDITPCVGIELLYSPVDRDSVDNFAQQLFELTKELTFNVTQYVGPGKEIRIIITNKSGPNHQLIANVVSCEQLNKHTYRIDTKLTGDTPVQEDHASLISIPINNGPSIPQEIKLLCPACNVPGIFMYVATQDGHWHEGILPIYNCSSCGTSRAMTGLLIG